MTLNAHTSVSDASLLFSFEIYSAAAKAQPSHDLMNSEKEESCMSFMFNLTDGGAT